MHMDFFWTGSCQHDLRRLQDVLQDDLRQIKMTSSQRLPEILANHAELENSVPFPKSILCGLLMARNFCTPFKPRPIPLSNKIDQFFLN